MSCVCLIHFEDIEVLLEVRNQSGIKWNRSNKNQISIKIENTEMLLFSEVSEFQKGEGGPFIHLKH